MMRMPSEGTESVQIHATIRPFATPTPSEGLDDGGGALAYGRKCWKSSAELSTGMDMSEFSLGKATTWHIETDMHMSTELSQRECSEDG